MMTIKKTKKQKKTCHYRGSGNPIVRLLIGVVSFPGLSGGHTTFYNRSKKHLTWIRGRVTQQPNRSEEAITQQQ